MAKLSIEVDTDNDKLTMTLNGTPIANVRNLSIYQSYDEKTEYHINIETMEVAEDGMRTYINHCMECDADNLAMAKASIIPGFVQSSSINQIQKDIQNWLKKG